MISPAACLLLASIPGIVGTLGSGCKPNVPDELIKDFCFCVGRLTKKVTGTNGRILPQLCEFVNMTSKGKCTVMKKALEFYRFYLKTYLHNLPVSDVVKKDLSKIKDYTQRINSNTKCGQCKSSKDHAAEKAMEKFNKAKLTVNGSSHATVSEIIFQLYALRNLLLEITNKLPFTGC